MEALNSKLDQILHDLEFVNNETTQSGKAKKKSHKIKEKVSEEQQVNSVITPISLELILKYGSDAICNDQHLIHQFLDPELSPATLLFLWDLIIILILHTPAVTYSKYAQSEEKSLERMQQFFAQENRYSHAAAR